MPIDNAVLLQVDVTAIFGIFVFLTVRQHLVPDIPIEPAKPQFDDDADKDFRLKSRESMARAMWTLITTFLLMPFAASSMIILLNYILSDYFSVEVFALAIAPSILAFIGFSFILGLFALLYMGNYSMFNEIRRRAERRRAERRVSGKEKKEEDHRL